MRAAHAWIGAVCLGATISSAQVTIDNGIAGDNRWQVAVENAGDTQNGQIDPVGAAGLGDVIYELFTYFDTGADGGAVRLSTSTTVPAALSGPNQVTSSGAFSGPNGTINWTAVSSIPANATEYNVALSFSSTSPFGTVRLLNYFDEDVISGDAGDDVLVVFGTPGASDFFLLTLDQTDSVGVGHTAGFLTTTNATYVGWAADKFSDLRTAITGAGASYSIPGVIDTTDLSPMVDPRFPSNPAYGPKDITQAFAFDLNPAATTATIEVSLQASPDAAPPVPQPSVLEIPTLNQVGLSALAGFLALGALWQLRRRRA